MSCLAIYISLAVGFFKKNYMNVIPSKATTSSNGEMLDKFSAHFPQEQRHVEVAGLPVALVKSQL